MRLPLATGQLQKKLIKKKKEEEERKKKKKKVKEKNFSATKCRLENFFLRQKGRLVIDGSKGLRNKINEQV